MRDLSPIVCLLIALVSPPGATAAADPANPPNDARTAVLPQRPFQTLLPWAIERGQWEIGGGVLHRDGVSPPFHGETPGTTRSEWRVSIIDATLGLGAGGEVQIRWGMQRFHEEDGLSKTGIEDARISFGYQLPVKRLATALRFEVKLPNAPDEQRLGTDEADIFMLGAVGARGERWGWAGNAGFGILGDPLEMAVQDDVLLLGVAAWCKPARSGGGVTLLAEVNGLAASRFGNDYRLARMGARFGGRWPIDLSIRRGLTSPSEDWGVEIGVTAFRTQSYH